MPLIPSGGRWTGQPPGQAFIKPEFQRDLIFAARGAAGGVLDFHKYVYTGNTGTGSSDPPAIVNSASDSADGKAWNTTSAYISGRNVTGADRPLVETEAARDWTFQFVVHNVQQSGTNPGFWRTDVAQTGTTFVIANGANRRPWVRINGTDVIKAASGAQWTLGQKLNLLVRVKSSSRVEVWWDGAVQHSATHSVATTALTATGSIFSFGVQNGTERIQGAVTAIRFWNRYLPDDQMALLGSDEWAFYKPRRIWVPVSAGGGSTSLTVNETAHAHSADALTLTTSAVLTIADSTHAHAAESPAPSSSLGLTIAEALHAHAADNLTLSVTGSASLVTADATHGHAADSLALSSDTGLTVADALHGHAADNLTLDTTGAATLTTQDATHAHAVDAPMLYTDWLLAVAEATHGHAAGNVSLSDAPELAPQDASHGHTADVLALSADTWLTIQQATQAQAADRLTLSGTGIAEPTSRYIVRASVVSRIVNHSGGTRIVRPR